ncbi:MAG: GNAT family N-acetyltransferase [Oscillospiraceae bacterium]|nr:GNAT family N-acetyltransferase [Oscillospiraceae bacterium]
MTDLRLAKIEEYDRVLKFYYDTIDMMQNAAFSSLWKKDVYPSNSYIKQSIEKGQLWVCEDDGLIVSSMVLNHEHNEGYKGIVWPTDAERNEVLIIHAFGVLPSLHGRGIGSMMLDNAKDHCAKNNIKAIRLDVLANNFPAEKLYAKNGFSYVATTRMFYEDTGWTDFKLFEYAI